MKKCLNCGAYSAYYTKGFCSFNKEKLGHCSVRNIIIEDRHGTCERWHNDYTLHKLRKKIAMRKIDDVLNCLIAIKQILFEEQEDIKKRDETGLNIF